MEALVGRMITESAERLGLDASAACVVEAHEVARVALAEGWGVDDAFAFGRNVLIKATQPAEAIAAA